MIKTTLNFFGEEVKVETPKDIPSLRSIISQKYLLSPSDADEIILYYIKDSKKTYIINGNDFSNFKEAKVSTIFLDINQNSKLYLDSASEIDKENQKNQKELDEINKKFKDFSKRKEKVQRVFEDELKQINLKIMEMDKKRCEIIKKKDIELIKMMKEKESFETKIYYLQKKLFLPITVPVPKDEKQKEISLKNSPKQLPMEKSFKNSLRYAPIKNLEIQKRIECAKRQAIEAAKFGAAKAARKERLEAIKLRAVAAAKENALKVAKRAHEDIINNESEIKKIIENVKSKSIASAKEKALIIGKKAEMHITNNHLEIQKRIESAKLKSVAAAKEKALKVGKMAQEAIINNKLEIQKRIETAKLKSVAAAKEKALKVGKLAQEAIINNKLEIQKRIKSAKLHSIASAKADALKVGKRAHEDFINKQSEIQKKIENVKLKSITSAKEKALNVAKNAHNDIINKKSEIQKRIEIVKSKSIANAKLLALKVGERASKDENNKIKKDQDIPINTNTVFKKVNEILSNTVDKVKEVAKELIMKKEEVKIEDEKEKLKKEEEEKLKEKEKKERIDKIIKITKETVNEINNLTKMVITQSNMFIEQINNIEKNKNITSEEIILRASKKEEIKKDAIHFHYSCDGCKMKPIRGNRYKCKGCPDFDFCENCYQTKKESHGHEFIKIEKPSNTRRMGHKNTKYCQRGIVHRNVRCENCGLFPLVGWRYMCPICEDYSLCENCEESCGVKHGHPFIKVTYPSIMNSFNNCFLKMNYYEPNKK